MNVILDVNIYITFGLDGEVDNLKELLLHPRLKIHYNQELLEEFLTVAVRKKFFTTALNENAREIAALILLYGVNVGRLNGKQFAYPKLKHPETDIKDLYLLKLCKEASADYLVTGDKWLLKLKSFAKTEIISLSQFRKMI